jgi:flagellar biosynthesis protein FlhB
MSGGSSGEKTEKATPKRIKQARKDGQIGNTPELGAWVGMLAASFVIPNVFKSVMRTAAATIVQVCAVIEQPEPGRAMAVAGHAVTASMRAVLPMSLMVGAVGIASVAGQGGIHFSAKALKPKFARLNPLKGIKRMFGPHGVWTLIKSLLKTAALAVVVYISVRKLVPTVLGSGSLPISDLLTICVSTVLGLVRYAAIAGLVMAGADFAVVRKRNNKSLKMSKHEIKEEFKSQEGDPHVRGQRRARQMAMSRNRMMADVPLADVVIVNPTHVAVALRYDPARGAPRIVAKGGDHIAARIRAIAEENRIPMVADIPLARTLYGSCEIGQEIPADLYKAVATVLAFIMTLKRRGSAAGVHQVRTLAAAS